MDSGKTLRYISIVGVVFLLVLFAGGAAWKQSPIKPIPQDKLQPLYRVTYGIAAPVQQIAYTKWSGGETVIDQDKPETVWFKPLHSKKWINTTTEELTVKFAKRLKKK